MKPADAEPSHAPPSEDTVAAGNGDLLRAQLRGVRGLTFEALCASLLGDPEADHPEAVIVHVRHDSTSVD